MLNYVYFAMLVTVPAVQRQNDTIIYPCTTPTGSSSYCISIFSCPHLMKSLSTLNPKAIDYVRSSICLGCEAGDYMVCCGNVEDFTNHMRIEHSGTVTYGTLENKQNKTTSTSNDNKNTSKVTRTTPVSVTSAASLKQRRKIASALLPSRRICGEQHNDYRENHRKTGTEIEEFSWLVEVIRPNQNDKLKHLDRCGGVAINGRYVLTSYYCGWNAIKVIVGQYNTAKSISCADIPSDHSDCTEPKIEFKVIEIRSSIENENKRDGFALLRLEKVFKYSDFRRAICLPINESDIKDDELLVSTGWGSSDATGVEKKKVAYKIGRVEDCRVGNANPIMNHQFCLVPWGKEIYTSSSEWNNFTCLGDQGGPVMRKEQKSSLPRWYLEGIVSEILNSTNKPCADTYNLKVLKIDADAINWILDSIYN